jgi:hypothetical protein
VCAPVRATIALQADKPPNCNVDRKIDHPRLLIVATALGVCSPIATAIVAPIVFEAFRKGSSAKWA